MYICIYIRIMYIYNIQFYIYILNIYLIISYGVLKVTKLSYLAHFVVIIP